jgi:Lamin Tail Domain/Bacterial Ig domain/Secretion system C-terminal sorting domain
MHSAMKKHLLMLFALMCFVSAQAQIVITEIMYNPPEANTDTLEYIEIHNRTNATVNLEGWSMFGVDLVFPAGTTLAGGGYLVTAKSSNAIQVIFNKPSVQWTNGALSNGGETLKVLNAAGATIDSVTYGNMAPWPANAAGLGTSIVLCDPAADNSLPASWSDAVTNTGAVINNRQVFANPAAASGCVTGLLAQPDIANIVPGQTTTISVLANDNTPSPITSLTILTPPANGNASVATGNTIQYTPNTNFCGADQLVYQICDGPNSCASATVSINVKCYPNYSISQVTGENAQGQADSANVSCTLRGVVYGVNIRASSGGSQFVIMNPSGANGIAAFRNLGTLGYNVTQGDEVSIQGTITQFNGLTQMNLDTVIRLATNQPLVNPTVVTQLSEATESRLVRFNNMRWVDATQWPAAPSGSGFNMRMYSPNSINDTITLRIDNDVELFQVTTAPSEPFDVIGLGGQFDSAQPFNSGYQLLPRFASDLFPTVGVDYVDYSAYVRITPNPFRSDLRIVTSKQFDSISIFNSMGQLVKTLQRPDQIEEINLTNLPAGRYAVRFELDQKAWTTQVIKE